MQSTAAGSGVPEILEDWALSQHVVVIAVSGLAQLISPLIVSGIEGACGVSADEGVAEDAEGAGAAGAGTSRVTAGVFTGGGGASPRHVVVIAFTGCAQLI